MQMEVLGCFWKGGPATLGVRLGPSSRVSADSCWGRHSESAQEILDKRYAQGEIGKEEYEEKKMDIQ